MVRAVIALAVGSRAAGVAQAQVPTAVRVTMPTKDAGVYHVATGTWTRTGGSQANLGPDVIYRADVPSGYFAESLGTRTDALRRMSAKGEFSPILRVTRQNLRVAVECHLPCSAASISMFICTSSVVRPSLDSYFGGPVPCSLLAS